MLDWLDHLTPPERVQAVPVDSVPTNGTKLPSAPPAGLLAYVRRMAEFYQYTPDETAHAIQQARADPESWRGMVAISMTRWGWTLEGRECHPWITPN
jgi:hypothetical protein